MHIMKVLDPLERLEGRIAEFYELLSVVFRDDAEASSFFYLLSVDEAAHVNLVRYQRRLVRQNMKLFADISLDTEAITALHERVASYLSAVPQSLTEAVAIAQDIERSAAEVHYLTAIGQTSAEVSSLLNSLGALDTSHADRLNAFAAQRGIGGTGKPLPEQKTPTVAPEALPLPEEIASRLDRYYEAYGTMDYYALLGISRDSGQEAIKHAYRELAHQFHPDSYVAVSQEVQVKLGAVFSSIANAYGVLSHPDKKRDYDRTLGLRRTG